MNPRERASRGIALVAVLWMVAALSLLVVGVSSAVRADIRFAQQLRAEVQAAALGDAAIQMAIRDLGTRGDRPVQLEQAPYTFDGHEMQVVAQSAAGFVNLNNAPESLLQDLFVFGAGIDPGQAAILAARVADWRDPDQAPLPLGAEDEAYVQAGSRFRTRSGPFEAPEDLLQVLGIEYPLYDKVQGFISAYGQSTGVDPLAASAPVLLILAQGNRDAVQAIAAKRASGDPAIDTTRLILAHVEQGGGTVYRMEAQLVLSGRMWSRVRWVDTAQAGGAEGIPWRTLRVEPVRAMGNVGGVDGS